MSATKTIALLGNAQLPPLTICDVLVRQWLTPQSLAHTRKGFTTSVSAWLCDLIFLPDSSYAVVEIMASNEPDLKSFLDPFLCANTERRINGTTKPCENEARSACAKCKLVQVSPVIGITQPSITSCLEPLLTFDSTAPRNAKLRTGRPTRPSANRDTWKTLTNLGGRSRNAFQSS
jgi:hypothetical protein